MGGDKRKRTINCLSVNGPLSYEKKRTEKTEQVIPGERTQEKRPAKKVEKMQLTRPTKGRNGFTMILTVGFGHRDRIVLKNVWEK